MTNDTSDADFDYNLLYTNGSGRILWGSTTYSSVASIKASSSSVCANCVEEDPDYVNAAADNFRLRSGSGAIGKGQSLSVYDSFSQRYGISIKKDIDNTARPLEVWDIGAFEYNDGVTPPPTVADPTNLHVVPNPE